MELINYLLQIDFTLLIEVIKKLQDVLLALINIFRGPSTAIITNGSL